MKLEDLSGFAACNLDEPSEGDLKRIYNAYVKCWKQLKITEDALNKIAMAGASSMAYTSDYTELANQAARNALKEIAIIDGKLDVKKGSWNI